MRRVIGTIIQVFAILLFPITLVGYIVMSDIVSGLGQVGGAIDVGDTPWSYISLILILGLFVLLIFLIGSFIKGKKHD